ncbi:MAG TPA: adenosine deaminase [Chloroflexota bacterium]|nr:adenosine deaminase [Chloroflexota bacterium]
MPRAHLHLHFPRTIRPDTLRELAARAGASLAGFYSFTNLPEFLARTPISSFITTRDDLSRLCRELVEDEARDGVLYSEPMIVLGRFVPRFGNRDDVLGQMREAFDEAGAEFGVEVGIMLGFSRHQDLAPAAEELARFAARHVGGVVALGFGGDEERVGPATFARACTIAREAGLLVVPHAGETVGPESVVAALDALHPDRIAHGVRAAEDRVVLARLADEGVTCDVCPTSNLRLGVSPSIERHPVKRMIDAGVPVTLGADDPIDFGVTCGGEYALVRDAFGLSDQQLAAIAETSARASGASQATKTRIIAGIQGWLMGTPAADPDPRSRIMP